MLRGGEEFVKTNCCELISTGSHRAVSGMRAVTGGPHPAFARRYLPLAGWVASGWIVPGGILLLLPKCPACIVAYLAIAGGIGISITAAIYLRMAIVMLCGASLAYFAVKRAAKLPTTARFVSRLTTAATHTAKCRH